MQLVYSDKNTYFTNIAAGLASTVAYIYLAQNSQFYGDANLAQVISVAMFCGLLSFFVWFINEKQGKQIEIITLLGFALLFRLIGLSSFPILEDDFYRYLWDARMTVEFGSPYAIAPAEFFDVDNLGERFETILDGINYPYVETVYGPSSQWLYALAYLISPGEVWPLQLLLGLADLIVILSLLKLAKPNSVLLYAWSPLVIKEFVISTHPDVLGVMFIVLALLILHRKQANIQSQKMLLVGSLMALACGVKVFAIVLVPFLLRFNWAAWLAFIGTATLIALPFGLKEAWLPDGLSAMGSSWLFNAPIYFLANSLFGELVSVNGIKIILLGAFALASGLYLLNYWYKNPPQVHSTLRGDLLYAGLFICAPALNAWYLVWLLPFAVFRPSLWAWSASLFIFLSYASGINIDSDGLLSSFNTLINQTFSNNGSSIALEPYEHWGWVLALQFTPPCLFFIASMMKRKNND